MSAWADRVAYFERRIQPADNCWRWAGSKSSGSKGGGPYGIAQFGGRSRGEKWYAHRLSWTIHRGDIPEGLTLDHLCRNTLCVNPEHLEPVPNEINSQRSMEHYRSTHPLCPQGHDEWVYRQRPKQGRYCAECNRIRVRVTKKENRNV